MRNLARRLTGDEVKDKEVVKEVTGLAREELLLARAELIFGDVDREREVPSSVSGKVGSWELKRAWTYWVASAPRGEGLALDLATDLHRSKYPVTGKRQPEAYGEIIRVAGRCGAPSPDEWVKHYDGEGLEVILDPTGEKEDRWKQMVKDHPEMEEKFLTYKHVQTLEGERVRSVIDSYHIDTQLGLKEFVRVVKESTK